MLGDFWLLYARPFLRAINPRCALRGISHFNSIEYCLQNNADFIFRLRTGCFSIYDEDGNKKDMTSGFSDLNYGESAEFSAFIRKNKELPVRICVRKKDRDACEKTKKRLQRRASRKQQKLSANTESFNEYIVLVTSLPLNISADEVLDTYRYRWQIENYFKRLKSILDFGDLPKKRSDSSFAWLNGKLMTALLIELFIAKCLFSPSIQSKAEHMA
jgi:hypothetical protein